MTVGGERHALPDPFFVLATQNPIEQEGTYPLPEAQLDRFMFKICVDYPARARRSSDIVRRDHGGARSTPVATVLGAEEIHGAPEGRAQGPRVGRGHRVRACAWSRQTRADGGGGRARPRLRAGVRGLGRGPARQPVPRPRRQGEGPPRAALPRLARRTSAPSRMPVLRHRIITNFHAEAEGLERRRDR